MSWTTKVTTAKANYGTLLAGMLPEGVDLATLLAIIAVESSGTGIDPVTAKPIIRFEVHKFYELHGYVNRPAFDSWFKFDLVTKYKGHYVKNPDGTWLELHSKHPTQAEEWYAFGVASTLDPVAAAFAIQSTSFGLGQIMGFNFRTVGFATPADMYKASFDVNEQVKMMVAFVRANSRLLAAARAKDWATFAKYYNGTGQVPTYSAWLKEAYAAALALPA